MFISFEKPMRDNLYCIYLLKQETNKKINCLAHFNGQGNLLFFAQQN